MAFAYFVLRVFVCVLWMCVCLVRFLTFFLYLFVFTRFPALLLLLLLVLAAVINHYFYFEFYYSLLRLLLL